MRTGFKTIAQDFPLERKYQLWVEVNQQKLPIGEQFTFDERQKFEKALIFERVLNDIPEPDYTQYAPAVNVLEEEELDLERFEVWWNDHMQRMRLAEMRTAERAAREQRHRAMLNDPLEDPVPPPAVEPQQVPKPLNRPWVKMNNAFPKVRFR